MEYLNFEMWRSVNVIFTDLLISYHANDSQWYLFQPSPPTETVCITIVLYSVYILCLNIWQAKIGLHFNLRSNKPKILVTNRIPCRMQNTAESARASIFKTTKIIQEGPY